jgi:hypothetical protein
VLALLSLVIAEPAMTASPQILVRFEVKSGTIKDGLRSRVAAFEHIMAQRIAVPLRARYGFVAWNAEVDPTSPVLGQIVAQLVDDSSDEMPPILVRWFAVIDGRAKAELTGSVPIQIYARNDPNVDATNQLALEQRTMEALDKVIPTDSFLDGLFKNFVSRVPLARSVTPIETDRVIELPLQKDDVPIGQQSVVDVEFILSASNGRLQGSLELTRFVGDASGRLRGGVQTAIVDTKLVPLVNNWHAMLPVWLADAAVQCFIITYQPDRSVGALVTEPQ